MAKHEVPDLHDVEEKIHAAHDAEDRLMHTMPNAIHPDDDAYDGMTGPSEGDVEKVDAERSDDERQAESPERTPTERVQDDLVENESPSERADVEERDNDEEASVESAVVEDDSPPPVDPDHR